MTFWIFYCVLLIADQILTNVESLSHLYFPLKFMLLIWMQYPKTKGAVKLYNRMLREAVKDNIEHLDDRMFKSMA